MQGAIDAASRALTRRRLLQAGAVATLTALAGACGSDGSASSTEGQVRGRTRATRATATDAAPDGRLISRPGRRTDEGATGRHTLATDDGRDALLYVPEAYRPDAPAPLAVMLHGAGGAAQHGLDLVLRFADDEGLLILAPQSLGSTWDFIRGGYGPDVEAIDSALRQAFDRYVVDPDRLAVGGFSDGASYALSLGITNGRLFSHILAFSPGFTAPAAYEGTPRIFISHGTRDEVLPIDRCSRRIVPQLERKGYDVVYREFDGPHTVPAAIAEEALGWFLA